MTETGLFVTWSPECPLTRHFQTDPESHRRETYASQENDFWRDLEQPAVLTRERVLLSAGRDP
jgi:hypothetical protein